MVPASMETFFIFQLTLIASRVDQQKAERTCTIKLNLSIIVVEGLDLAHVMVEKMVNTLTLVPC